MKRHSENVCASGFSKPTLNSEDTKLKKSFDSAFAALKTDPEHFTYFLWDA